MSLFENIMDPGRMNNIDLNLLVFSFLFVTEWKKKKKGIWREPPF